MIENAESSREKLMQDVNQVVADTEQLLKSAGSAGSEKAQALRRDIEQRLRSARSRVAELQDSAVRGGREAARVTDDYVRQNPWQSVAAAAGVGAVAGLVVGLLLARDR